MTVSLLILWILWIIGLAAIILILSKVKELHDWGYGWGYSFFHALGGH